MKKALVTLFLLVGTLSHAAFLDDDLDGVANEDDRCPNSALTDIVDADGCAVEKVTFKKERHFDISVGYLYAKVDEDSSQNAKSLSFGYYYGDFSAWLYTSDYNLQSGESGIDDTTLALYYRRREPTYTFKAGIGGYIPSDSQNANSMDYFVTARVIRYVGFYDISAEYQHTFMQDDATIDSDRLTLSAGYAFNPKSYASLSYTEQSSIYEEESNLRTLSLYVNRFLNDQWYLFAELSKGLSESATDFAYGLYIGYYF